VESSSRVFVVLDGELADTRIVGEFPEEQPVTLVDGYDVVMLVSPANFRGDIPDTRGAVSFLVLLCHNPNQQLMVLELIDNASDKRAFFRADRVAGVPDSCAIVIEKEVDHDAAGFHGVKPALPLIENIRIETLSRTRIYKAVMVGGTIPTMGTYRLEVDTVSAGFLHLVDKRHLVAVAGTIGVASAPVVSRNHRQAYWSRDISKSPQTSHRHIQRKLAQKYLPKQIANRRKQDFGLPLGYWFKGQLGEVPEKLLCESSLMSAGYLRRAGLLSVLNEHRHPRHRPQS
jgi:hypothetical protein